MSLHSLRLTLLIFLAGIFLSSCSDTETQHKHGVDQAAQAVLSSASVQGALAKVIKASAPIPALDIKAVPATRTGPKLFFECRQFFVGGQSPLLHPQRLHRALCFDSFAILHSGHTKTPVFCGAKTQQTHHSGCSGPEAHRPFFADSRLPRLERAELQDYRRSGYSRGHMAPAGDMPNPTAMEQSFSLANMIPQSEQHNGGPWSKVEQDTRKFVRRAKGDVYVITGPFYSDHSKAIGESQVLVPDHVFKLVYDEAGQRAWAHWHTNRDDAVGGPPISYRELVKRTGIEFLPGVDFK